MTQPTALQSALVFVRPVLTKILDCAVRGHGPLAVAAQAEAARSQSVHVQRKLQAGDLIGAASSAKASDDFRDVLEDTLSGPFQEVREALLLELRGVLSGDAPFSVPVDRARSQHLPRTVIARGVLDAQTTREVAVAAPIDAALLAHWVLAQDRPERSTAHGFVQYAANNSAFMNRLGLFGTRVRMGEDQAGRPLYDYDQAVTTGLDTPMDGNGATLADTLRTTEPDRDAGGELEHALYTQCRAQLGRSPGRLFGALFAQLCAEPDLRLATLQGLHSTLASRHAVPVAHVTELAHALDRSLTTLRQTRQGVMGVIQ